MSVYRRLAANSIQDQVKKGRSPETFWARNVVQASADTLAQVES